jgi:iron complex transport system substrate-binding protein
VSLKATSKQQRSSRVVSFLPSSTEIIYAIGAGDQITGVTHECKYPDDAKSKPRVIDSAFDPTNMTSKEIDNKIVGLMKTGGNIYVINDEKLKEAKPDLIIAQGVCEVCAPFTKEIDRAGSVLGYKPDLLILDPHDLEDILVSIMDIAERVGRVIEGRKLVVSLQNRIDNIRRIVGKRRETKRGSINGIENPTDGTNPRIVCIEWIDPFFTAGHWIPQMVDIVGGNNGLGTVGQPSRRVSIEEIMEFNPDKIILMPCGFDIDRTSKEAKSLSNNDKWKSLQAVQRNEVYAVNANAFFSKPGPRTITGLEILAKIIDPEGFKIIELPINSFCKITNS